MRNENAAQDDDSWTAPSTVTGTTTNDADSFVNVETPNVLQLKVAPRNDSVGFFSNQPSSIVCVNIKDVICQI